MTDKQIEKIFCDWFDKRKGMPPPSFESFKAGWMAAMKCAVKSRVTL